MRMVLDALSRLSAFTAAACLVLAIVAVPTSLRANDPGDPGGQPCPCGEFTNPEDLIECWAQNPQCAAEAYTCQNAPEKLCDCERFEDERPQIGELCSKSETPPFTSGGCDKSNCRCYREGGGGSTAPTVCTAPAGN